MSNSHYSEHEAGAKTFWVIEFLPYEKERLSKKDPPSIHFIPTYTDSVAYGFEQKLGVCVEELEKQQESEQLETLSESMDCACQRSAENCKSMKDHTQMMNEQIENLGRIVDKFNNILREFNNKEEEES